VGTQVTWTATPTCFAGVTPEYQFWMQLPGGSPAIVQTYSTSAMYAWATTGGPAGAYQFWVTVRAVGSGVDMQAYTSTTYTLNAPPTNTPTSTPTPLPGTPTSTPTPAPPTPTSTPTPTCAGAPVSFTASPPSAQVVGTTITWTASVSCSAGATPEFQISYGAPDGSGAIVQAYSTNRTYIWNSAGMPTGVYDWNVWVRAVGSSVWRETYNAVSFNLSTPSNPNPPSCTNGSLSLNWAPQAPVPAGTQVTFTAAATCPNGATPEYKWLLGPTSGSGASFTGTFGTGNATFVWNTTGVTPNTYQIEVWVRAVGSNASWELWKNTTTYVVTN